ncbi:MAG: hypothetical protein C4290_07470 [Chloroflexota bacterium]
MIWYDRHAAAYERARPDLPGEREFYGQLAREAHPPLLVLACSTGRIALTLAAVVGPVVGLDRSAAMLAVARAAAKGVTHLYWVSGCAATCAPSPFGAGSG